MEDDKPPKELEHIIKKALSQTTTKHNENLSAIISEIRKAYAPNTNLNLMSLNPDYQVFLSDGSIYNPFVVSTGLLSTVKRNIPRGSTDYEKAYLIFCWMEQNIKYGNPDLVKKRGYLTSEETLKNSSGICAEMTFLYITLARSAGLTAKVVYVNRDMNDREVNHACAAVLIGSRQILVDIAYHTFGIKHKSYRIIDDLEVLQRWTGFTKNL